MRSPGRFNILLVVIGALIVGNGLTVIAGIHLPDDQTGDWYYAFAGAGLVTAGAALATTCVLYLDAGVACVIPLCQSAMGDRRGGTFVHLFGRAYRSGTAGRRNVADVLHWAATARSAGQLCDARRSHRIRHVLERRGARCARGHHATQHGRVCLDAGHKAACSVAASRFVFLHRRKRSLRDRLHESREKSARRSIRK